MGTGRRCESGERDRPWLWLRRACIVLAGVETVALTGYAGIMATLAFSSDPLPIIPILGTVSKKKILSLVGVMTRRKPQQDGEAFAWARPSVGRTVRG
jgi:hypothetical protein